MRRLPDYRLRLFLSVDLVGSTAFKADKGTQIYEGANIKPKWVSVFTEFYEEFPSLLRAEYDSAPDQLFGKEKDYYPRIWKTIGDELILCSRIISTEQLAHSMSCFVAALRKYSGTVKQKSEALDVKGNAWVAACPAPNIGFALDRRAVSGSDGLDTSEYNETLIDEHPHRYDFLGKAIDTGFRIAQKSRADRCTMSVQLAFLISDAKDAGLVNFELGFDGRVELKGVNNGIPYPVVYINTETDQGRKKLASRENDLVSKQAINPKRLNEFLQEFMEVASIEFPYIDRRNKQLDLNRKPESFLNFEKAFNKLLEGLEKQDKSYEEAETTESQADDTGVLDDSSLDAFLTDSSKLMDSPK